MDKESFLATIRSKNNDSIGDNHIKESHELLIFCPPSVKNAHTQ